MNGSCARSVCVGVAALFVACAPPGPHDASRGSDAGADAEPSTRDVAPRTDADGSTRDVAPLDGVAADDAAGTGDVASPARDPAQWPFAVDSPWNTPIGSGATYEDPSAPVTVNLRAQIHPTWINWDSYSSPVYVATASDPRITLAWDSSNTPPYTHGSSQFNMPTSALPSMGTDGSINVISPDHGLVHESWQFMGSGTAWHSSYYVENDTRGPGFGTGGIHAAGCSNLGGIPRRWELDAGAIRHAVNMALDNGQMHRGWVWPAIGEDGDAAATYAGMVPMGTLAAIPASVDVASLGLTPEGLVLAHALQDYGAYVVDRAYGTILEVDPLLTAAQVANLRHDVRALQLQLVRVLNNTATSVGGGGATRRAPPAPPLR